MNNRSLVNVAFAGLHERLSQNFGFVCALALVYGVMMRGVEYLASMFYSQFEGFSLHVGSISINGFRDLVSQLTEFVSEHIDYRLVLENIALVLLASFVTFFIVRLCLALVQQPKKVPTSFIGALGYCIDRFRLDFVSNLVKSVVAFCAHVFIALIACVVLVGIGFGIKHLELMLGHSGKGILALVILALFFAFIGLFVRFSMMLWCLADKTTGVIDTINCSFEKTRGSVLSLLITVFAWTLVSMLVMIPVRMILHTCALPPLAHMILILCLSSLHAVCGFILYTQVYQELEA